MTVAAMTMMMVGGDWTEVWMASRAKGTYPTKLGTSLKSVATTAMSGASKRKRAMMRKWMTVMKEVVGGCPRGRLLGGCVEAQGAP